ncbi:MAG: hypothetical protein ACRC30_00915 [Clostridium sp.]
MFSVVEKVNTISQENTALTEEIAANTDIQASVVQNLNISINKINNLSRNYT